MIPPIGFAAAKAFFTKSSVKVVAIFLVLAVAVGIGAWGGYRLSLSRALEAEKNLEKINTSLEAQKKQHEKLVGSIQEDVRTFQAEAETAKSELQIQTERFRKQMAQASAAKAKEIQALSSVITAQESELKELLNQLQSTSDPRKRQDLISKINEEQVRLANNRVRQKGLECLSVPVPAEFIPSLQGTK